MMLVTVAVAVLAASAPRLQSPVDPGPDSIKAREHSRTAVGTLYGTVRTDPSGDAIVGARLEWVAAAAVIESDSAGHYLLRNVSAGTGELRITHEGYDPLTLNVTLPSGGALQVDAVLTPRAAMLATIDVHATRPGAARPASGDPTADDLLTWRWDADARRASVLTGGTDVFRTLSADPHVSMRGEPAAGIADRGGAPDETLVRLDGLPLWYPFHGGGVMSALSPDAVAGLALRDGAGSAGNGERLSGVVDVRTRPPAFDETSWGSALETHGLGASWNAPFAGGGGALVAVRRGYLGLVPGAILAPGSAPDQWSDLTATVTVPASGGTLHALAFASGDRLAFNTSGGVLGSLPLASRQLAGWQTGTAGLIWNRPLTTALLTARAWAAGYHASAAPAGQGAGVALSDVLHQVGTSTELSWHAFSAGASAEALGTHYRATLGPGRGSAIVAPLDASPRQTLVSGFVDQRWGGDGGSWSITTGLRGSAALGLSRFAIDPHVSWRLRVAPNVSLVGAYGRAHQYVQSLRNGESEAGAALGADLPVVAGARGVPVASGDEMSAGVVADLSSQLRFTLDGYVRHFSGLALIDPRSQAAAAISPTDTGHGRAVGFALQLEHVGDRFSWLATYGVGRATRTYGNCTYHPSFELGQAATVAAAYRVTPSTQVRLAAWTSTGRQASLASGAAASTSPMPGPPNGPPGGYVEGSNGDGTTGPGSGMASSLGVARVPQYSRVDIGVIREWALPGRNDRLSTFLSVNNLLARRNAFAVVTAPGTVRAVGLQPLSIAAGIAWHF